MCATNSEGAARGSESTNFATVPENASIAGPTKSGPNLGADSLVWIGATPMARRGASVAFRTTSPTREALASVNHTVPPGPAVTPPGKLLVVGVRNAVALPLSVRRTSAFDWAGESHAPSHRFLSGPTARPPVVVRVEPSGITVTVPPGVTRPIRLAFASVK